MQKRRFEVGDIPNSITASSRPTSRPKRALMPVLRKQAARSRKRARRAARQDPRAIYEGCSKREATPRARRCERRPGGFAVGPAACAGGPVQAEQTLIAANARVAVAARPTSPRSRSPLSGSEAWRCRLVYRAGRDLAGPRSRGPADLAGGRIDAQLQAAGAANASARPSTKLHPNAFREVARRPVSQAKARERLEARATAWRREKDHAAIRAPSLPERHDRLLEGSMRSATCSGRAEPHRRAARASGRRSPICFKALGGVWS